MEYFIIGSLIMALLFIVYKTSVCSRKFIEVEATVDRINERMSTGSHSHHLMLYQPEFTYEWNGWTRTIVSEIWSSKKYYEVGDTVILLINPNNPREFRYKSVLYNPASHMIFSILLGILFVVTAILNRR